MAKGIYAKDIDLIEAMKVHQVKIRYSETIDDYVWIHITPEEATRLGRTCPDTLKAEVSVNQKYCVISFEKPS